MSDLIETGGMLVLALTAFVVAALWVGDGWLVLLCAGFLLGALVEFCLAWWRFLNR